MKRQIMGREDVVAISKGCYGNKNSNPNLDYGMGGIVPEGGDSTGGLLWVTIRNGQEMRTGGGRGVSLGARTLKGLEDGKGEGIVYF